MPVCSNKVYSQLSILTLDQALENELIEIKEIEDGQVPSVDIKNLSQRYIFIMGGEIITGCKQDRIVEKDVLLGPGKKDLAVPVFCV